MLDQFSRNLARGTPAAYAQALAREAMESPGLVDGFAIWELQLLADLYRRSLGQAQGHRDVIVRCGRHPQRNAVLGRTSTPEELAYLAGTPVHLRRV